MSSSTPPQIRESSLADRPPPLTHSTVEGEVFTRRADVEAEIIAALAKGPASWVAMANARTLKSESIVHLIRHLRTRVAERRVLGQLVEILERRATRIVERWAQGFDEVTTEEIAIEVGTSVLELVLARTPDRASEFLEISFSVAVQRRTINAVEKRQHQAKPEELADEARKRKRSRADDDSAPDAGDLADPRGIDPETAVIGADQHALLRSGLSAVKDARHREAVILHHLRGWPITDKDPDTQTLCKHFGMAERQIRTWIATAMTEMREAIGEKS